MAFSAGPSGCSSEINVTPLIDVLLVLIIIFMVIGPTPPHGLHSSIPSDSPATASQSKEPVTVSVLEMIVYWPPPRAPLTVSVLFEKPAPSTVNSAANGRFTMKLLVPLPPT